MKSNRLAFRTFHSKKLKPHKSLNLKIDDVNINDIVIVKYFGVTFDSCYLTWKNHIDEFCSELSNIIK